MKAFKDIIDLVGVLLAAGWLWHTYKLLASPVTDIAAIGSLAPDAIIVFVVLAVLRYMSEEIAKNDN